MNRVARAAVRLAFIVAAVSVAHDLAGIRDADAPYAVDDAFVYRLFAASRAAMLAVAASLLAPEVDVKTTRWLGIALIGLAANNNWFTYSPDDPFFWPAAALNYVGVAIALAGFLIFVTHESGLTSAQRRIGAAALALGLALALLGIVFPVLTFGPRYEPVLAAASNTAYWIVTIAVCVGLVFICLRPFVTRHEKGAASATTLAAFVVLGIGTTVHGMARIMQSGAEAWIPGAIDALCQCAFAALLAVTAFSEPGPALLRAARWTGFGGLIAAVVPLTESALHEKLLAIHIDRIGAFGGEENGRMLITIASGLAFARLDKIFEKWRNKEDANKNEEGPEYSTAHAAETAGTGVDAATVAALRDEIALLHQSVGELRGELAAFRLELEKKKP